MTREEPILRLRGVSRRHGQGATAVTALRDVDLDLVRGEFVALMGTSGAGKSTLLHLVAGLDQPDSGSILLSGQDMARMGEEERTFFRRQQIGLIFQSFQLLEMLTAEENVALPLVIAGGKLADCQQRARELLDEVGLGARRQHRPHQLSGGEQQRVAIARALVIRPALLLADEPTGNLDSAQGARILALLRQLVDQHRQTLLLVTHDPVLASHADRIIILQDGKLQDGGKQDGTIMGSRIGNPYHVALSSGIAG